jgi:hypothetical protein
VQSALRGLPRHLHHLTTIHGGFASSTALTKFPSCSPVKEQFFLDGLLTYSTHEGQFDSIRTMAAASSSALGPTATQQSLEDAVSNFQRALSNKERRELQKMSAIPNADAILVFTAELDAANRTRKGESFASRLHSVLSSMGSFCNIVDTYVSTHPEIAGLVWGSIKLTMLVSA